MDSFWNRSPTNTPIQPAMELATSRVLGVSHWMSTNRNVKIGLAVAVPSLILLISTTPVANGIVQTWKRVTGQTSKKTRPERGESRVYDKAPELPKKSYGQLPSGKKTTRQERSEQGMSNNNNNKTIISNIIQHPPQSPKKSYAAAASAAPARAEPVTPLTPLTPLTPDDASFFSDASSEHSHKQKFRLGQNIKKRWQNRTFGHSSSENVLSP
jgi:hypothetical protein